MFLRSDTKKEEEKESRGGRGGREIRACQKGLGTIKIAYCCSVAYRQAGGEERLRIQQVCGKKEGEKLSRHTKKVVRVLFVKSHIGGSTCLLSAHGHKVDWGRLLSSRAPPPSFCVCLFRIFYGDNPSLPFFRAVTVSLDPFPPPSLPFSLLLLLLLPPLWR